VVQVGDRVAGIFFKHGLRASSPAKKSNRLWGAIDGMLVEYVVLHQDGVVLLPDHLSYEEGATLPCAAVTAARIGASRRADSRRNRAAVRNRWSFDLCCNLPSY